MNELNQLVVFLTETLKQGLTVAQDKVPAYVEQVLAYGFIKNLVGLVVWVLLLTASIIALTKLLQVRSKVKAKYESDGNYSSFDTIYDWSCAGFTGIVISVMVTALSFLMIIVSITQLIKIKVAPIVYLIERTAQML